MSGWPPCSWPCPWSCPWARGCMSAGTAPGSRCPGPCSTPCRCSRAPRPTAACSWPRCSPACCWRCSSTGPVGGPSCPGSAPWSWSARPSWRWCPVGPSVACRCWSPAFFSGREVRADPRGQRRPGGAVREAGQPPSAMFWQAMADLRFRMLGGLLRRPRPHRASRGTARQRPSPFHAAGQALLRRGARPGSTPPSGPSWSTTWPAPGPAPWSSARCARSARGGRHGGVPHQPAGTAPVAGRRGVALGGCPPGGAAGRGGQALAARR